MVIGENSTVQPLVATLFQLVFLLIVLKLGPYESDDDDLSSFVSSLTICLTTLGGMILITEGSPMGGASFDEAFLSNFLILITVGTIAFQFTMTLLSTDPGARLRARACRKNNNNINNNNRKKKKDGGVRVVPAPAAGSHGEDSQTLRSWGGK